MKTLLPWNFLRPALVILLLGFLARIFLLHDIPTGFTHDEVYFAVEAKSVSIDGRDLTGTNRPWLTLAPSHEAFSELPGTLMAPGFWLFSDPIVAARAVAVLAGTLLPLMAGLVALRLTGDRRIALGTVFAATWNPWIFQFSRSSIDPLLALFLVLVGTWLHLSLSGWKKSSSLFPYIVGFYTYQGYKLIWLPLVLLNCLYLLMESGQLPKLPRQWKKSLPLVVPGLVMLVVFGWYIVRLQSQSASARVSNLLPFDQPLLSSLVDTERRLSLPSPLQSLAANKLTVMGWRFLDQYSETFHPKTLFLRGEAGRSPFSVWSQGMFLAVDAVLIGLGAALFLRRKRLGLAGLYLLGVLLVAPLPTALNTGNVSVTFRSSLLIFPLVIAVGAGLALLWEKLPRWGSMVVVGAYLLFAAHFFYQYFLRYPVYAADGLFLFDRVASNYAERVQQPVLVVSNDSSFFLLENYLFFNNKISRETLPQIRADLAEKRFRFGNVEFRQGCLDTNDITAGKIVIAASDVGECEGLEPADSATALTIAQVLDSGEKYRIYNDTLCQETEMRPFLHLQSLNQFRVENLTDSEFCQHWITDLRPLREPSQSSVTE